MTIHAVDLVCAPDSGAAFIGGTNSYISVWLTNYIAWEPDGDLTQDNREPTFIDAADTPEIETSYYSGGIWRFDWSEDKSILLDNLVGQADAYCPWYRIRWHECDHDEDDRDGCQWDDIRTAGTIPEGI